MGIGTGNMGIGIGNMGMGGIGNYKFGASWRRQNEKFAKKNF